MRYWSTKSDVSASTWGELIFILMGIKIGRRKGCRYWCKQRGDDNFKKNNFPKPGFHCARSRPRPRFGRTRRRGAFLLPPIQQYRHIATFYGGLFRWKTYWLRRNKGIRLRYHGSETYVRHARIPRKRGGLSVIERTGTLGLRIRAYQLCS